MARPLILSLDVQTKSAQQSLDSFRKKMRSSFTSTDTKALEQNIKNTTKEINKLEGQIDKTKQKLRDLGQSDTKPKSVVAMEIETTGKKFDEAMEKTKAAKEAYTVEYVSQRNIGLSHEQALEVTKPKEIELTGAIQEQNQLDEQLTGMIDRANELQAKLTEVKGNPELTAEGKRYNQELDEATKEHISFSATVGGDDARAG